LGPELFFNPEIFSTSFDTPLPNVVDNCIQSSPIDCRRPLYNNIVLSGGSTMFQYFDRRLQRDVKAIVDQRLDLSKRLTGHTPKPMDVNVLSHAMQRYAVWFGGSMLGTTVSFYFNFSLNSIMFVTQRKNMTKRDQVLHVTVVFLICKFFFNFFSGIFKFNIKIFTKINSFLFIIYLLHTKTMFLIGHEK
jgi:hypothetical protein